MQYNKNGNSRSWSSWRILLVLGLFVAVAAFGMLVSQQLLLDNARRVSRSWCARGVRRCYEVDLRIKSVSGVDGADELKLLLMELAQEARA